jgi:hypothetical protein
MSVHVVSERVDNRIVLTMRYETATMVLDFDNPDDAWVLLVNLEKALAYAAVKLSITDSTLDSPTQQ